MTGGLAFAVFALLWVGFGAALIWSQGSLDASWRWIRALPLVVALAGWNLWMFLPMALVGGKP